MKLSIYLALTIAATVLFLAFPGIDLWASGLFYRPGEGFFLAGWGPFVLVYRVIPLITTIVAVGAIGGLIILLIAGRPVMGLRARVLVFLLAGLAIGPGLVTNTLLKDHWGRARPLQIEAFGGTKAFSPAILPADSCERNCSFVAGHAALAFYLVSFAFLLRETRRRRLAMIAALGFGGLVGLVRIGQGGHFLSDVLFAGLINFAVVWALYTWLLVHDGLNHPVWRRLADHVLALSPLPASLRSRIDDPTPALSPGTGVRRRAAWTAGIVFLVSLWALMRYVDLPVAIYFHGKDEDFRALWRLVSRLGDSTGYLVVTAAAFAGLFAAARMTRSSALADRLRAYSYVPLFIFVSVSVGGLTTDLVKTIVGRARPRLWFRQEVYGFQWFGSSSDFWSFPSGHTATITALAAALYFVWPRHLLFYVLVAAIVGFARVGVGAHYPSDVLIAAAISVLTTCLTRRVFERSNIRIEDAAAGIIAPAAGPRPPWTVRLGLRRA